MAGTKKDQGKLKWSLLPIETLQAVIRVMTFGDQKYTQSENYENGMDFTRLYDANLRHLTAWRLGEDIDPETGESHIAHAICCSLMLLTLILRGFSVKFDDRNLNTQYVEKE